MATLNLWPDEITQEVGITGPAAILREQAALLGKQTKNIVKGTIVKQRTTTGDPADFGDAFVIEGPLIDYHYDLLYVFYPIDFYPALIRTSIGGFDTLTARNEEDFLFALKTIFSDPKTIGIIQAIITRSKQEQPPDDEEDSDPSKDE